MTYRPLSLDSLSSEGGVIMNDGSGCTIASSCILSVCRFRRKSLQEAEVERSSRFRRRPLVPKLWSVPIDGNRKLHAIPSVVHKKLIRSINSLFTCFSYKSYI